jgi:5-formyltetrahydrofolate cyclo-ligase
VAAAKQALRRRIRAERNARSAGERHLVAGALRGVLLEMREVRRAGCLALYASRPDEPGTALIRETLREIGTRVLLPVVLDDLDLDWAVDDGRLTPSSRFGVLEPEGPRLGRDALAHRLGQGGGSYDRALHRTRTAALVLALVHDEELFDAAVEPLPVAPHDLTVSGVVTPTRWMRLTNHRVGR